MATIPLSVKEGVAANPRLKMARGIYDFAVDTGAQAAVTLMKETGIPSGATIVGGWIDVHTQCTSGAAATIAVHVEGAGDIVPNSVAIGAWTAGQKKIIPGLTAAADLSASAVIRTTAARDITATIATADLTAGKFSVVLIYTDPMA